MTAITPIVDRIFPKSVANDITLVISGAILTTLAAQVVVPMYPVPMTLQTFAVLLIAAALGPWRALSSMGLYFAMGAAGLPVFAAAKSLSAVMPTAGYLVGFMVAGVLVGFMAIRGFSSTPVRVALSFAAGSLVIYLLGAGWLVVGLGMSPAAAIAAGVLPFILGDVVKAAAAAALLPTAWKFVR